MARSLLGIISALCVVAGSLAEQGAVGQSSAGQPAADAVGEELTAACEPGAATRECVGKAACLQVRLESAALHMQDLSAALDDLLAIDRLAHKQSFSTTADDEERRAGLEAELSKLEQRVHAREVNGTVDTEGIIKRLKHDIRALSAQEERALYQEARKVGEAARRSARDLQAAVRHSARKARSLSDKLSRVGHERRKCADIADILSRRVESAADHVERKGEVLARRIDKAVRSRLRHEEAELERRPRAEAQAASRLANATDAQAAPTRLFLAHPRGPAWAPERALLLVAMVCAGASLATLAVKRTWHRATAVSPPESVLG